MIQRKINVNIDITPEELAFEFCDMDSDSQVIFFNEIAELTKKWSRPFCLQLQYITDSEFLTEDGRNIMLAIGEYSEQDIK